MWPCGVTKVLLEFFSLKENLVPVPPTSVKRECFATDFSWRQGAYSSGQFCNLLLSYLRGLNLHHVYQSIKMLTCHYNDGSLHWVKVTYFNLIFPCRY